MTNWARLISSALLLSASAAYGQEFDFFSRGLRGLFPECRTITGLTVDQKLVTLNSCEPTYPRRVRGIAGLTGADAKLVGIDYRVQDGRLYGLGNGGGIYEIDPMSGMATKSRQVTVPLNGDTFGVDFNPAANALRIISNSGQNLRHPFADPAAATVVDGALNYTMGQTATGVTAGAYVNNDLSANTGTFLFDIDSMLDQLSLQQPPNSGTLVRVGALGMDAESRVAFDIYSTVPDEDATENTGYAALVSNGVTRLYEIDLLTGAITKLDVIREDLLDIALPLEQRR